MPSIIVVLRDLNTDSPLSPSTPLSAIDIAGFCLVGALFLGVIIVGIKLIRKRAQRKREDARGAAFLSVRGLVRDGEKNQDNEPLPESLTHIGGNTFSRQQMTSDIILPDKVLPNPKTPTRNEIIRYHRESGNFPRPFAFALSASASSSSQRPSLRSSSPRSSVLNPNSPTDRSSFKPPSRLSVSSSSRFSVVSTISATSTATNGHARKVHQLFSPVLPDELLLTRVGERLTLVQSFDDGWCVVGRKNAMAAAANPKSLYPKPNASKTDNLGDDVEIGVVPAWCFLKPVKGLRAERPVRSSSLGITVQMEGPAFSSREEVVSWSNF